MFGLKIIILPGIMHHFSYGFISLQFPIDDGVMKGRIRKSSLGRGAKKCNESELIVNSHSLTPDGNLISNVKIRELILIIV